MKTRLILLFASLIVTATFAHGQSKKDLEINYAACLATNDSLQEVLTGLSEKQVSLNKAYLVYDTMYNVIKQKVLLYDFDPANISALIDSLSTNRESAFSGLSTTLNDSISALNEENARLKETIESLSTASDDKVKAVEELKQLKDLLDSQIITKDEFDQKKAKLLEKL